MVNQRLDAAAAAADVGAHEVDLGGHAPGPVVWPPQVGRLEPRRMAQRGADRTDWPGQQPHPPVWDVECGAAASGITLAPKPSQTPNQQRSGMVVCPASRSGSRSARSAPEARTSPTTAGVFATSSTSVLAGPPTCASRCRVQVLLNNVGPA